MKHTFTKRNSRLVALLLLFSFLSVITGGCTQLQDTESLVMTGIYFDTVIQVEAWGADQEIMDHCEDMCIYYEELLSPTIDTLSLIHI